jgi:hypothetical protein
MDVRDVLEEALKYRGEEPMFKPIIEFTYLEVSDLVESQ